MHEVEHLEDCIWKLKNIKKTKAWWDSLGLKACPNCGVEI